MATRFQPTEVECYSGQRFGERPMSFLWQGERYSVERIEREWLEPGQRHFRVLSEKSYKEVPRCNRGRGLGACPEPAERGVPHSHSHLPQDWGIQGVEELFSKKYRFELVYNEQKDAWQAVPQQVGETREATMKEILEILEKDARTPPEAIATMTGRTTAEVEHAINEAEKGRIILKYKTVINWDKVREPQVWALVEVRVQPQRGVGFDAVAERIYRFPQARTVYLVSGAYDLAVLVVGKTIQEVAAFVSEKLATLEWVQGTTTHFLLKKFKEDGDILEDKGPAQRLPISA